MTKTDELMKLADEAIHAYAAWLAEFITGELPSLHTDRLNSEKDAARERLRAAIDAHVSGVATVAPDHIGDATEMVSDGGPPSEGGQP